MGTMIDTLGYVKRLTAVGVSREQAEAHAEAFRDEIAAQVATKADMDAVGAKTDGKIDSVAAKLESRIDKVERRIDGVERKIDSVEVKLGARLMRLRPLQRRIWKLFASPLKARLYCCTG
jgi:chromosome segregation ATPase